MCNRPFAVDISLKASIDCKDDNVKKRKKLYLYLQGRKERRKLDVKA